MKEIPILMTGTNVVAILEGRKTQTRRIMKPQPEDSEYNPGSFSVWYKQPKTETHHGKRKNPATGEWENHESTTLKGSLIHAQVTKDWFLQNCPYGQPGDRLWVKEAYRTSWVYDGEKPSKLPDDTYLRYEADGYETLCGAYDWSNKVRPSLFMPQKFSRILLEVVSVRVERLQDISQSDAQDEGVNYEVEARPVCCRRFPDHGFCCGDPEPEPYQDWIGPYRKLWESINGKGSWDLNPWVWVVEFKRIKP